MYTGSHVFDDIDYHAVQVYNVLVRWSKEINMQNDDASVLEIKVKLGIRKFCTSGGFLEQLHNECRYSAHIGYILSCRYSAHIGYILSCRYSAHIGYILSCRY